VVEIDGAVVWLFIVAAAACRKLVPCQCCVFTAYFSVRIDVGLQEVSSSRYFDISGQNPVFPHFGFLQVIFWKIFIVKKTENKTKMIEKNENFSFFYINDSDTFAANPTELITTSSHCVVGVNVSSF